MRLVAIAAFIVGCGDNKRLELDLDPQEVSMPVGVSTNITVTESGSGVGSAGLEGMQWTVDDPSIATTEYHDGVLTVTGTKVGTTRAHTDYHGDDLGVDVVITEAELVGLALNSGSLITAVGLQRTLHVEARYTDGRLVDITALVSWAIDDPTIVALDGIMLHALKAGTTYLTAAFQGKTTRLMVTVTAAVLTAISVDPPTPHLVPGLSLDMTASGTFSDGAVLDVTDSVEWTSDAPGIATMSGRRATAVAAGETDLHASVGEIRGASHLTVVAGTISKILISPDDATIALNQDLQLHATAILASGDSVDITDQVTWASTLTSIATVNADGLVHGAGNGTGNGTSTITADFGNFHASATITVVNATLQRIDVTPNPATVATGTFRQLTATGVFSDGVARNITAQAIWSSDHLLNATVAGGLVFGLLPGTATITASFGGLTGTSAVTVTLTNLTSIAITAQSATMPIGTTQQLEATAFYTDGTSQDVTSSVVWASDRADLIAVSNAGSRGLATSIALGTANITATLNGTVATKALTATAATLIRIDLTPATLTLAAGSARAVVATGVYTDGSQIDLTNQATWTSSADAIASVSNGAPPRGVVLAKTPGDATITATFGSQATSLTVHVSNALLVTVQIAPSTATLPVGLTRPLVATATYSDGTTLTVTGGALWSSSSDATATVSNAVGSQGLITAKATGNATITATLDGVSATAEITVTAATLTVLQLTPPTLAVPRGAAGQLTATGVYSDGSTHDLTASVQWTTSAPAIASVEGGKVTGLALGTATITATSGGVTATATITVGNAIVASLSLDPPSATIPLLNTAQVHAIATYTDATTLDLTEQVVWTSSNPLVASVSNAAGTRGQITALLPGTAVITATSGAVAASMNVTVTIAVLTGIEITPAALNLAAGGTAPLVVIGTYSDGSKLDITNQATFASSDTAVATVSSTGVVTATAAGGATITAQVGLTTATTSVLVTAATLDTIQVAPASLSLPAGTSGQLTATGIYSDGSHLDLTAAVTWTSSAPATAAVSNVVGAKGKVTAITGGTATITAALGAVTGTATVNVSGATASSLAIEPTNPTVPLLTTRPLTATATYTDGTVLDATAQTTWTSSNPLVASVSNANGTRGRVSALLPGTATITATYSGLTATTTVTVTVAVLTSTAIVPASLSLASGLSAPIKVIGTYSDGTTADITSQAMFSTSNAAVASVSTNGTVTAQGAGNATVTATVGLISSQVNVTVTNASVQSIAITPSTLAVPAGTTAQLTATATYSDGTTSDVTALATWTSSAPATASVGNARAAGKVSGGAPGSATITAALGGVTGTAPVTVSTATLGSLAVTPATANTALGLATQLTATATYSDSNTANVTEQATWSSSNPLVASVSNATGTRGRVTGLLPGTATITASFNGQTATATITVGLAVVVGAAIDPATLNLPAGVTAPIKVIGTLSDGTTTDLTAQATFTSSDPDVATVDVNGNVTAKAAGTTTITANVGTVSASVSVNVVGVVLQQIQINPPSLSLPVGSSAQLTAVGIYSDGTHQDLTTLATWTSSAPATVSVGNLLDAGKVTANAAGSATITAAIGGVQGTLAVTATTATLSSLAISPATPSIALGQVVQLKATGTYSDGSTQDLTAQVTWGSSNPLVAAVSNLAGTEGWTTGLLAGTATITATSGSSGSSGSTTASATVTVTPAVLLSAQLQPTVVALPAGLSAPLALIGTFSDGTTADITAQANFASADPLVASVSTNGVVTANGPGTTTITANAGAVSAQVAVTIVGAVLQSIQLAPTSLGMPIGTTQQMSAVGIYSDGTHQDLTLLATWTSSAPTVASVGNLLLAGRVTANAVGTATITAQLAAVSASAPVTVTAAVLSSLSIDPPAPSVVVGQTLQLTATGVYSDNSTVNLTEQATWTSSNPLVVAVSSLPGSRGLVTGGLLPGNATITATVNGVSSSVTVANSEATLVSMQIAPAILALPNGLSQQLAVTGIYSDGSSRDLTSQASWSSSAPTVAAVTSTGLVTAKAVGAAVITATYNGVSAVLATAVTPATLASIQVTPASTALARGTTLQMTATGVYSDGTHQDLTLLATWSSNAPAVASVGNLLLAGRVTANAVGSATITASFATTSASSTVAVTAATLASLAIMGGDTAVPLGLATQLTAIGTYSDGSTADVTSQATWTSSSGAVVVSNAAATRGQATAVSLGQAVVTATIGAVSAQKTIGTTSATLLSIDVGSTPALPLGLGAQLTATGHYSDGTTAELTGQVTWSSSNPVVAAVTSTGLVTALAQGSTNVSASLNGVTGVQVVTTTTASLQTLIVAPPLLTLAKGLSAPLVATGVYSNGSTVDVSTQVTWSSSAPAIATVTNTGTPGVVTAVNTGTATITAQLNGKAATATVIVTGAVVASISISGAGSGLAVGSVQPLTATATYTDGTTVNVTSLAAWTSSIPSVVSVSNLPGFQGQATAQSIGTATVTATVLGTTGTTSVVVGAGCHAVINELKVGELLSGSNEFIEIYNPCSFPVNLANTKLVYRTLAGIIDITLVDLASQGTLAAGGYRVFAGASFPGTWNGTFSTDLPTLGGGVALRDAVANVIIDSVGYGIAVNLFVEGAVSLAPPLGQTIARIPNGQDTNNNAADFQTRTATPGAANQ